MRARIRGGHRDHAHGIRSERVDREHGHESRVDPSRQPDDRPVETVLACVVADPEGECTVDVFRVLGPGRSVRVDRRPIAFLTEREVDDQQVLLELGGPPRERAVGSDEHAPAVEYELVLPADGVHVHDPRPCLDRPCRADVEPLGGLPPVVGGAVDVHDEGNVRVSVRGERRSGRPCVFADRDAERHPSGRVDDARLAGHEVASLVEHAVVRQADLVVARADPAAGEDGRGVVHATLAAVDEAGDDHGPPVEVLREPLERGELVVDERPAQHEILGRVPGDGELRETHEVRVPGPLHALSDLSHVAVEVPDGEVQLAERDTYHTESVPIEGTGSGGISGSVRAWRSGSRTTGSSGISEGQRSSVATDRSTGCAFLGSTRERASQRCSGPRTTDAGRSLRPGGSIGRTVPTATATSSCRPPSRPRTGSFGSRTACNSATGHRACFDSSRGSTAGSRCRWISRSASTPARSFRGSDDTDGGSLPSRAPTHSGSTCRSTTTVRTSIPSPASKWLAATASRSRSPGIVPTIRSPRRWTSPRPSPRRANDGVLGRIGAGRSDSTTSRSSAR